MTEKVIVYVVIWEKDEETWDVLNAYSTEERALSYINKHPDPSDYWIKKMVVDKEW